MMQAPRTRQHGAATLLTALLLMMSITVVTLSVARTQITEQKITNNDTWHTRLWLQAESALATGATLLGEKLDDPTWVKDTTKGIAVSTLSLDSSDPAIHTAIVLSRPLDSRQPVTVRATARGLEPSTLRVTVSQAFRPLSVLSPAAESAPPLVLNGCLLLSPFDFHIRPLNADSDVAGDAIWLNRDRPCPVPTGVDLHHGSITEKPFGHDLWTAIFSVDREQLAALAAKEAETLGHDRHYRVARASELHGGRWTGNVGSARDPAVLYFPPDLGCPGFADGVQIYGIVFIDSDCSLPITGNTLQLYGSLVVNGNLNIMDSRMKLGHIQIADALQTQLRFPVLRSVPVPGTWKDF